MKKTVYKIIVVSMLGFTFLFISCKLESNRVVFSNDLDHMTGWTDGRNLTTAMSHSGSYSCVVGPESPYGFSFSAKCKQISDKKFKKVRISFYVYEQDEHSKSSMVFEIKSGDTVKYWNSAKAFEMVKPGKWSIITHEYELNPDKINPEDEIRMYPWGQGTSPAYFDDYILELYW